MNTHQARAFLEDIVAHPDDDTPRLIFADWLEEEGESARSELIRVQIERTRLPEWDARQVLLQLRERELIEKHGEKWKRELPRVKDVAWLGFRRGFVATATFRSFTVLASKASRCWAATPLEAVSVRWPRKSAGIESLPPIPGLRELAVDPRFHSDPGVARLADAPLLATLRTLILRDAHLGFEGLRRFVVSPHLRGLTALRVQNSYIGNGISALFDDACLTSLAELELSGPHGEGSVLGAADMAALAAWPGMNRLRSLKLSGNDGRREGLRALLCSQSASGLKELSVRGHGLDDQAMQEFAAARPELQLDVLDLSDNVLGDLGPAYLASAPCLRELKVLALERCGVRLSGARDLVKAPFLDSLRRLNVNYNSFGQEGLRALLEMRPRSLHTLEMVYNDLGDEGIAQLAESPASDDLLELKLIQNNNLGDRAALALATSEHLRSLLVLRIGYFLPLSRPAVAALDLSPLGQRLAIGETIVEDDIPF